MAGVALHFGSRAKGLWNLSSLLVVSNRRYPGPWDVVPALEDWDTKHEEAWDWLWSNVEKILGKELGKAVERAPWLALTAFCLHKLYRAGMSIVKDRSAKQLSCFIVYIVV